MRVLCVEDEVALREDLAEYLRLQSYEVDEADNGEAALDRLRARHYDAVLCDVRMPKMDGYTLLENIRSEPALVPTPFIFLTAFGDRDDRIRAHQSGCDTFLTKPVDFNLLNEVIASNIARQQARDGIAHEAKNSLACHVVQAVSESLHRPMAEAITMVEHLRESKASNNAQALDQALAKLELKMNDHMDDLFLLVGAMQLQMEEGVTVLSREPMTASELRLLALPATTKKSRMPVLPDEPTVRVDRSLMQQALSHLLKAYPKSRALGDAMRIEFWDSDVAIIISDRARAAELEYKQIGVSMNFTELSDTGAAYVIPILFASQAVKAHGGQLAVNFDGEHPAIRITLPR